MKTYKRNIFQKILKVINSCNTGQELESAGRYVELFRNPSKLQMSLIECSFQNTKKKIELINLVVLEVVKARKRWIITKHDNIFAEGRGYYNFDGYFMRGEFLGEFDEAVKKWRVKIYE